MYKYGKIEDVKPGDIVEYCSNTNSGYTVGRLYISTGWQKDIVTSIATAVDNSGSTTNGMHCKNFKLVLTAPGSTATAGDTVMSVDPQPQCSSIPIGSIHTVNRVQGHISNRALKLSVGSYSASQFVVLQTTDETPKLEKLAIGSKWGTLDDYVTIISYEDGIVGYTTLDTVRVYRSFEDTFRRYYSKPVTSDTNRCLEKHKECCLKTANIQTTDGPQNMLKEQIFVTQDGTHVVIDHTTVNTPDFTRYLHAHTRDPYAWLITRQVTEITQHNNKETTMNQTVEIKVNGSIIDLDGNEVTQEQLTELEDNNSYFARCFNEDGAISTVVNAKSAKKLNKLINRHLQVNPFNTVKTYKETATIIRKDAPVIVTKFKD